MEKLNQTLTTAGSYQGLRERAEQEPRLSSGSEIPPSHRIWDVWDQVKSAYPGPTTNWDDVPPTIWAYSLEGLTDDEVATGIKRLVVDTSEFPPSAGQFREMCQYREPKKPVYVDTSNMIENKTAKEKRKAEGLDHIHSIQDLMK
jgi:hypothetical protein